MQQFAEFSTQADQNNLSRYNRFQTRVDCGITTALRRRSCTRCLVKCVHTESKLAGKVHGGADGKGGRFSLPRKVDAFFAPVEVRDCCSLLVVDPETKIPCFTVEHNDDDDDNEEDGEAWVAASRAVGDFGMCCRCCRRVPCCPAARLSVCVLWTPSRRCTASSPSSDLRYRCLFRRMATVGDGIQPQPSEGA